MHKVWHSARTTTFRPESKDEIKTTSAVKEIPFLKEIYAAEFQDSVSDMAEGNLEPSNAPRVEGYESRVFNCISGCRFFFNQLPSGLRVTYKYSEPSIATAAEGSGTFNPLSSRFKVTNKYSEPPNSLPIEGYGTFDQLSSRLKATDKYSEPSNASLVEGSGVLLNLESGVFRIAGYG